MGSALTYTYGQTPLTQEELDELMVKSISTRGELDELEEQNIEKAQEWLLGRNFSADKILSEEFILGLHRRMFGDVWSWAGQTRNSNKNIIVTIHCFPNGNGRHSRLMADIMIEKIFHKLVFSWGRENITIGGKTRSSYLAALKSADQDSMTDLIAFARS